MNSESPAMFIPVVLDAEQSNPQRLLPGRHSSAYGDAPDNRGGDREQFEALAQADPVRQTPSKPTHQTGHSGEAASGVCGELVSPSAYASEHCRLTAAPDRIYVETWSGS